MAGLTGDSFVSKANTLEPVRHLTPDRVLFSLGARLKPMLIIYVMETI